MESQIIFLLCIYLGALNRIYRLVVSFFFQSVQPSYCEIWSEINKDEFDSNQGCDVTENGNARFKDLICSKKVTKWPGTWNLAAMDSEIVYSNSHASPENYYGEQETRL